MAPASSGTGRVAADPADAIEPLAQYVARFDARRLPAAERAFQSRRVLDNLGTLIAGHDASGVAALHRLRAGPPADGDLPVWLRGGVLPPRDAVFLHSVMARAHDFCDVVSPGYHPGSTDVPVGLAMALAHGRSGVELLAALALGLDVALRINRAAQANGTGYRGFDPNMLALFSGTVVAGRLVGLDARALRNALGLAFNHGAGTFQMYSDKTLAVRIAQGNCSQAAIEAVGMAAAGLTGVQRTLDGADGFFRVYAPAAADRRWLGDELGERFHGRDDVCFKLHPSCSVTLALTEAALRLREALGRRGLSAESARLEARTSPVMFGICGHPFELGSDPTVDAMFSVQYVAANALLRGRSTLAEFTDAAVRDTRVVALARDIAVVSDPSLRRRFDACVLRASLPDGSLLTESADTGRGWPPNSPTQDELEAKFRSNLRFAGLDWLALREQALVDAVLGLAETPDLLALSALLSRPA